MTTREAEPVAADHGPPSGPFGLRSGTQLMGYFVALSLIKLVLIADHEIVAAARGHDDYWHIQAAALWVWGRTFSELTLVHLPTYALYVAVSGAIGIPLRISIEIVYLVCAVLLSTSLGRLGLRRPLQVVVFSLLAFHPYIYEGFDFAMPEMLYTCLTLAFVGLFIRILMPESRSKSFANAVLFALTSAVVWHLRKESILIEGLFVLIALGIIAAFILKFVQRSEAISLAGRLVVGPLCAVALLGITISSANGVGYGLWNTDQLSAPNYVRMFSSLLAIRPDHPIRFVPVTKDTRQQAYAVSPAFRELQPILDGDKEHWTATVTRSVGIGGGEIAAGWFYWSLIDAASAAGHFKTPTDAETFYGRIADEVEAALKDGRLPRRRALLPYVDPSFAVWLPYLPASIVTLAKSLFPSAPTRYPDRSESLAPDVVGTYNHAAKRRIHVRMPQDYAASGWVVSTRSRPLKVEIVKENGENILSRFELLQRKDVTPFVKPDGSSGPDALGFRISWSADETELGALRFKTVLEGDESAFSGSIGGFPLGIGVQLLPGEPASKVFMALDQLNKPEPATRAAIVTALNSAYPVLIAVFSILAFICVVRWLELSLTLQSITLFFVLAIVCSRVLFFAVLDASAWSAEQTRYLLPASVLLPVIPAIIFTFRRRRNAKS